MMQQKLLLKMLAMGFLAFLLLIPLSMIESTISERRMNRDSVRNDIAASWTGSQKITGPLLAVPYKEKLQVHAFDPAFKQTVVREEVRQHISYILPDTLRINSQVKTEKRSRGIFSTPVYTSKLSVSGTFQVPEHFGIDPSKDTITLDEPFITIGIDDIRGIREGLIFNWEQTMREVRPGTEKTILSNGVHVPLGKLNDAESHTYNFSFDMEIQGLDRLEFAPLGKTTNITLASEWPHPLFIGRFLPTERQISDRGFSATWKTTHFATNAEQTLNECLNGNCRDFLGTTLGVALIEPVDIYVQANRSVKYGILFVTLTFVVFFLFEVLKRLSIHPIQYGLVGAALALFYLLLISLSEHLEFGISYCIAAGGCVALLSFYVSYVLKSFARGCSFGTMISTLYGVLYVLLQSEDYALLMGSLLLFAVLAAIMVLTRHIDWYQVSANFSPNIRTKKEAVPVQL